MADEERRTEQVGTWALERDGRPVGAVELTAGEEEAVGKALAGTGLDVRPAQREGDAVVYDIGGECEAEKPRPCELEAALVMAESLAEEGGSCSLEIREVLERRHATEAEVRQAVRSAVDRLPEDMRGQGRALLEEARL